MIFQEQVLPRINKADKKATGDHYTPCALAQYLASELVQTWLAANPHPRDLTVLDPACGDGELLIALLNAFPAVWHTRLQVIGFDTNHSAIEATERRLADFQLASASLYRQDFLSEEGAALAEDQLDLDFHAPAPPSRIPLGSVDLVISNPPYVRTQTLGSLRSQALALRFGLSGRVDLYHAFVIAMTKILRSGGYLGLLTSNRFLSTQAGATMRDWLSTEYRLTKLVDLGDTRLFEAAVLPAIVIAEKTTQSRQSLSCPFVRMYESVSGGDGARKCATVVDALAAGESGEIAVLNRTFKVEVGVLRSFGNNSAPWILTSNSTDRWIESVRAHQSSVFADVAKVCVGVKTTADKVFVRDDWDSLPVEERPEESLLRNLITHHIAERWTVQGIAQPCRRVLYPYIDNNGTRQVIESKDYPNAMRYLETHRPRLQNRQYLTDAGRAWYEIWVPHTPSDWHKPKIAFPDISSENLFFMAEPGWIVNGDCYWITLAPSVPESMLYTMLAVANSTFALRYYDVLFHNKLYAGRRRFMSQYVRQFPLPRAPFAESLSALTRTLLDARERGNRSVEESLATELDALTWESFGVTKEP